MSKKKKLTDLLQPATSKYSVEGPVVDEGAEFDKERERQIAMIREAEANVAPGRDLKISKPTKKQQKAAISRTVQETPVEQKREVVAQVTGQSVEQVAAKTTTSEGKEKKKGGLSSQFKDALIQLAPSAIGLAVGAAVEGSSGGAAGFEAGNKLGQQLNKNRLDQARVDNSAAFSDVQQQQVDLKLDQRGDRKFAKDIFDTRTGARALVDSSGNVVTQDGQPLPIEFQNTDIAVNRARLQEQGDRRANISEQNTAIRQKSFENRVEEQSDADRIKLIDSFEKDSEVRVIREALGKIEPAKRALESGSPMAPGLAQSALARLSGEVGALTETDLSRFGGKQDLVSKVGRLVAKQSTGAPLTGEDKKDFLEMLNILEEVKTGRLNTIKDRKIQSFSKASGDIDVQTGQDILESNKKDINSAVKSKLFGR